MAYRGEIEVIQNWQDLVNAISNVTANFYAVSDTYVGWSGYTTNASCTLDGTTETKTIKGFDFRKSKKILLGSITKNVQHNADGTKTSETSVGFQIPASFYAKIPNSKTGQVTLTCTTYNGNTSIGTSTATFTVTASEEKCKPNILATLIDANTTTVALTGDNSKLIKYKSTAKITPTATAKNSATIKSIAVNGYAVSGNFIAFENAQSETFTVIVTDSRGYTNTLELKPTVIQYIPLSATAKFDRLSATSSEVKVKYSGNYYNGSFGSVNNALTISWAYKEKDASSWTVGGTITPTITNNTFSGEASLGTIFNYKTAYDFILYVSDQLSTVNPQETVKKGETIFDYGVDADGNNYFWINGDLYTKGTKVIERGSNENGEYIKFNEYGSNGPNC